MKHNLIRILFVFALALTIVGCNRPYSDPPEFAPTAIVNPPSEDSVTIKGAMPAGQPELFDADCSKWGKMLDSFEVTFDNVVVKVTNTDGYLTATYFNDPAKYRTMTVRADVTTNYEPGRGIKFGHYMLEACGDGDNRQVKVRT